MPVEIGTGRPALTVWQALVKTGGAWPNDVESTVPAQRLLLAAACSPLVLWGPVKPSQLRAKAIKHDSNQVNAAAEALGVDAARCALLPKVPVELRGNLQKVDKHHL